MQAIRFFRVVPLHSTSMLVGLAALAAFGIITLAMDSGSGMDATVPVLLLRMFAASSGFAVPARRGHFDLVLTGGTPRLHVALVHWAMSIAPGLLVWALLGAAEWTLAGHRGTVFSNGSVAAIALISMLGWALTVPLPRLSGGVVWLVALFIALAASGDWRDTLLRAAEGGAGTLDLSIVFLVCPLFLVGTSLDQSQVIGLLPGLAVAVGAMVAAFLWILRVDFALEAAQ